VVAGVYVLASAVAGPRCAGSASRTGAQGAPVDRDPCKSVCGWPGAGRQGGTCSS